MDPLTDAAYGELGDDHFVDEGGDDGRVRSSSAKDRTTFSTDLRMTRTLQATP
jgi:hypothetical protein